MPIEILTFEKMNPHTTKPIGLNEIGLMKILFYVNDLNKLITLKYNQFYLK